MNKPTIPQKIPCIKLTETPIATASTTRCMKIAMRPGDKADEPESHETPHLLHPPPDKNSTKPPPTLAPNLDTDVTQLSTVASLQSLPLFTGISIFCNYKLRAWRTYSPCRMDKALPHSKDTKLCPRRFQQVFSLHCFLLETEARRDLGGLGTLDNARCVGVGG